MRTTGIILLMVGLLFGLDAVNVGAGFLDEGPVAWILAGCGVLLLVGSLMGHQVRR